MDSWQMLSSLPALSIILLTIGRLVDSTLVKLKSFIGTGFRRRCLILIPRSEPASIPLVTIGILASAD